MDSTARGSLTAALCTSSTRHYKDFKRMCDNRAHHSHSNGTPAPAPQPTPENKCFCMTMTLCFCDQGDCSRCMCASNDACKCSGKPAAKA
jgi:hypothetical protein